jgi:hypothetical protein
MFSAPLFPSYVPSMRDMPQYTVWGESFLMFFFVIITSFALATVTLMDDRDTSSMFSAIPSIGTASKTGGKKSKH